MKVSWGSKLPIGGTPRHCTHFAGQSQKRSWCSSTVWRIVSVPEPSTQCRTITAILQPNKSLTHQTSTALSQGNLPKILGRKLPSFQRIKYLHPGVLNITVQYIRNNLHSHIENQTDGKNLFFIFKLQLAPAASSK